ncbi:hypothetical protein HD554DRAFT_2172644 [Boletus coccyginus]|nr:hypothetical protein HD554DRAFT_2172644 [Boletus coccyginus]
MTRHHAIDTRLANLHGKLTSRRDVQVVHRESHPQVIARTPELQGGNTQHIAAIENELKRQLEAQHGTFTYPSIAFAHSQSQVVVTEADMPPTPVLYEASINLHGDRINAPNRDEHVRGREEPETRGLPDRGGAMLAERGGRTSAMIVNGPFGKESTKRKAPEDNELMSGYNSMQPTGKKMKMVARSVLKTPRGSPKTLYCKTIVTSAHQAPASAEDDSQSSDSDGITVLFGGMPEEEESQWKHELYDRKIRKAMKIVRGVLHANGELIASVSESLGGTQQMFHMEYIPLICRFTGTLDNPWNIGEMLKMWCCWDGLTGMHPEFERTFDQEIYNLNKKYSVAEARKKYIARALSKGLPFTMKSIGAEGLEIKSVFAGSLILKTLAAHLKCIAPVDTVPYDDLVDRCAPWGALVLALTAVERALIRWQSGEEDRRQEEFSERFWGAKSLQYTKSVRSLSKVKLDEIFRAARTYLEINTRMAYDNDEKRIAAILHDVEPHRRCRHIVDCLRFLLDAAELVLLPSTSHKARTTSEVEKDISSTSTSESALDVHNAEHLSSIDVPSVSRPPTPPGPGIEDLTTKIIPASSSSGSSLQSTADSYNAALMGFSSTKPAYEEHEQRELQSGKISIDGRSFVVNDDFARQATFLAQPLQCSEKYVAAILHGVMSDNPKHQTSRLHQGFTSDDAISLYLRLAAFVRQELVPIQMSVGADAFLASCVFKQVESLAIAQAQTTRQGAQINTVPPSATCPYDVLNARYDSLKYKRQYLTMVYYQIALSRILFPSDMQKSIDWLHANPNEPMTFYILAATLIAFDPADPHSVASKVRKNLAVDKATIPYMKQQLAPTADWKEPGLKTTISLKWTLFMTETRHHDPSLENQEGFKTKELESRI